MTTKTPARLPHRPRTNERSASDVFHLLADDRRLHVLDYLSRHAGDVSLGELAEQVAIREDDPTYDHYQRILTSLYHTHLPQLVDCGMVRYDVERETVTTLDAIDAVRPYLDIAKQVGHL